MTQFLDIHLASDAERIAAHENCHDVWSLGLALEDHVFRRESSALHRRARWIVGCLDGRVVAALASHWLRFRLHGRSLPGIGLASVHTLREFRGQGFAQRMVRWIEPFERQRGARISVLFCDIEPRYYERLGYVVCPSHAGWSVTAGRKVVENRKRDWELMPAPTGSQFAGAIAQYAKLYDSDHGRRALSIERTADYWQHLAERQAYDERFWLASKSGQQCGYTWLRTVGRDLLIDDHAVRDGDESTRSALFEQVTQLAVERGLSRAGGWLPTVAPAGEHFAIVPRRDEITMLKPLDEGVTLDAAALAAMDWLQEIDHV
jgi:GNAT superfamily N-acetyltransferase